MSTLMMVSIAVAIFVLWHFLPKRPSQLPQPSPRFRNDPRLATDQGQWRAAAEEHCESPAEVAFLRAMISAYDLKPERGSLVADGLRLDFQVEESRYRVDFLVNRWLVVEIDGAAFHSSPEARAQDQRRDRNLHDLGYTVLRIPARKVFSEPALAIGEVRAALQIGKRTITPQAATREEFDGLYRLGRTLSSIPKALVEVNDYVSSARAKEQALTHVRHAAAIEVGILEQAIVSAQRRITHDDWVRESPERAKRYEQHWAELSALFAQGADEPVTTERVEFLPPALTGNPENDAAIEGAFEELLEERRERELSMKQVLSDQPRLRPYVQETLTSNGLEDLWDRIR